MCEQALDHPRVVDEGTPFRVFATFGDPGQGDTHTARITWQDLSPDTIIDPAVSPIIAAHVYGDNRRLTIAVNVFDDEGASDQNNVTLDVLNVAPNVDAGPDQVAFVGDAVSFLGSFDDPGTLDTHTVEWAFGDNTGVAANLTPDHIYTTTGLFTAELTVTDDDGETGTDSAEVRAVEVVPLPEGLEASDLNVSNPNPIGGEPVSARVRITNTLENPVAGVVLLLVNGVVHEEFLVELRGRASKTLRTARTNPIVITTPGVSAVQAGDQLATINIGPPEIVITRLRALPKAVGPGSDVEITYNLTNRGRSPGEYRALLCVDDDCVVQTGVILPEETIGDFRRIDIRAPFVGLGLPGPHFVELTLEDGSAEQDFYRVVSPVVDVPLETRRGFNSDTSTSTDEQGNPVAIGTGDITLGGGSITLSLPLFATLDDRISSFVDTTTGIQVIGNDVRLPIKDPDTGETVATIEGRLTEEGLRGTAEGTAAVGTFESVNLVTELKREDLSGDDPLVGKLGVSIKAGLDRLPENVNLKVTIKKELTDADKTQVELLARDQAKIIANEAGTVTIETPNLTAEDVTEVEITMKISFDWILEFGRANVRIAHVDDEGNVELLDTVCSDRPDENFEFTCVGVTQRGFSEFSLLALVEAPEEFLARNLAIEPGAVDPGEAIQVSVDIVNQGTRTDSFSSILKIKPPGATEFEPTDVKRITLAGGQTDTIRFFVIREEQGHYDVDVEGLPGAFDVFAKIRAADLELSQLKVFLRGEEVLPGETVEPGDPLEITVTVRNEGRADGRAEVEFRINEVLTEIRSLAVPGNGRLEDVRFDFTPPAEGTYNIKLIDPEELIEAVSRDITAGIPLEPARFVFAALDIVPVEVGPGGVVTVTFQLSNLGELPGTRTVVLLLDGEEVARQDIRLDELSLIPVTFTIAAPAESRIYELRVENLTGTFSVVAVVVLEPRVERVRLPAVVPANEPFTVDVVLVNDFDIEVSRTLTLRVDGQVIEPRLVTLAPGQTKTETFTLPAVAPGPHELEIDGLRRTFVASVIIASAINLVPPLAIFPEQVQPGDLVTIRVVLRNSGLETGQTDVILRIRDQIEEIKKNVQVEGEKTVTVIFNVKIDVEGAYDVEVTAPGAIDVDVLGGTFTVAFAVAKLILVPGSLSVEPTRVDSGEPLVISIDITNEGLAPLPRRVIFFVDGKEIGSESVTVRPGKTETVFFRHVERGAGTHTVEVEGFTTTFVVTKPAPLGVTIPLVVIFALLVIGLAVLVYSRARRGVPPPAAV